MRFQTFSYFLIIFLLSALFYIVYQQSQKITYLSDNQEIRNLANKFTLFFDDSDLKSHKKNYLANGVLEIVSPGKEGQPLSRDKMEGYFSPKQKYFKEKDGQYRHLITNVSIISQTKNFAFVKANLFLLSTMQHRNLNTITTIRCEIKMKKVNGKWLLENVTSYLDRGLDQN